MEDELENNIQSCLPGHLFLNREHRNLGTAILLVIVVLYNY